MKRIGNLYQHMTDMEEIKRCIKLALKGKKKKRKRARYVLEHIDNYAKTIQNILINKIYKPSPYIQFDHYDICQHKTRHIYKPNLKDHIIHWIVIENIKPLLLKGMDYYCCCNVKGRGATLAKNCVESFIRKDFKGTKYCLKLDIHHFFESIDKNILMSKLNNIIKDKDIINVLREIIYDQTFQGLPIGAYTSHWLGNLYLQSLDHALREKYHVKYMVRYMDDIVILSGNKRFLRKILQAIKFELTKLKLVIKNNWQIYKVGYTKDNKKYGRPVDFCGYKMYRHYTTIRKTIFKRFRRVVLKLHKNPWSLRRCRMLMSYNGFVQHSDSYNIKYRYYNSLLKFDIIKSVLKRRNKK